MRAVAFQIIGFMYIVSFAAYIVDETILIHTDFEPRTLEGERLDMSAILGDNATSDFRSLAERTANPSDGGGNVIDRIGRSLEAGYGSIWVVIELLTGNYAINVLHEFGVHPAIVFGIKLLMPLLVASTIIWYLAGRY
ncbi:MAG: hypothetical protein OXQ29_04190 [Rhodospirillaceae bacterium]|nr:hypothetical protein [Rhodospirillaceae bacterium]